MDRLGRLAALMALVLAVACGDRPAPDASAGARSSSGAQGPRPLGDPAAPGQPPGAQPPGAPPPAAASGAASPGEAELEAGWPLHGLVTGTQLVVRDAPDPEAGILGWLRVGSRLRARSGRVQTPTCSTGWVQIHPRGWACAGQGITIEEAPPEAPFEVAPPDREAALPYAYYFVKEPMVPQYHRLPSREAQRESAAFAGRYLELLERDAGRAARLLEGELGGDEPARPAIVARYLSRGFFLAGSGLESVEGRLFVRTVSGAYVQQARLEERRGSELRGIELDEAHPLPIPFAVRDAFPRMRRVREDGSVSWIRDREAGRIERHGIVPGWLRRERVGDEIMHILEGDRYLHLHFVGLAERIEPPFRVGAEESWVHVDLSEQTLVLYRGPEPVYATLVSTGLEGHQTPTGVFHIRRKLISSTMANLGPEAGDDRYRIEDVPWTQYFEGSIALHAAFWHNRFGLPRSHGCVNLPPHAAHRVFEATAPRIPAGWHGLSAEPARSEASRVVVTE